MNLSSKPRREADVKAAVAKYLKARGVRYFRMQSGAMMGEHKGKPWRMNLCPPGTPDFLVLRPSVLPAMFHLAEVIWLEVKRPLTATGSTGGSEQNDAQLAFQRDAESRGERYFVVRSIDDAERALA